MGIWPCGAANAGGSQSGGRVPWQVVTSLGVVIAVASCGGAPLQTANSTLSPAVHELAWLAEMGHLDEDRLACASVDVLPLIRTVGLLMPETGLSDVKVSFGGQGESSSQRADVREALAGAERAAGTARAAAAEARAGDPTRADHFESDSDGLLRAAGFIDGARVIPGLPQVARPNEEGALLEEYASIWALLVTEPGVRERVRAEQLARMEEDDPGLMETYSAFLLYAYRDPDLACGTITRSSTAARRSGGSYRSHL